MKYPDNLVDSHVHLNCLETIPEIYHKISSITPGVRGKDLSGNLKNLSKTKVCTGIHPMFIEESVSMDKLTDNIENANPVAIGECGLDRRNKDTEKQLILFESQIRLALDLDLPLVIHLVGHVDIFLKLLKKYQFKAYLHFFGLKEVPRIFFKENIYFGFCSRLGSNSYGFQKFKDLPIEKVLIETDGDDEFPPDNMTLIKTYIKLAKLKGMELEELAKQVFQNNQDFYRINL